MVNKYYQKHKEKLQKEENQGYQNLCEEVKEKKRQHHHERNNNLSEKGKEKKVEYKRNYHLG